MTNEIYPIGELPKIGEIPSKMHAATIRQERYGNPLDAFVLEEVPVPQVGKNDVLIAVMAAGVNYDGVWAALGEPIDIIKQNQRNGYNEDYKVCGSYDSGIVWAIGENVKKVTVGDEVVISDGVYRPTQKLTDDLLKEFNVKAVWYNPNSFEDLKNKITKNTKLIYVENPGSNLSLIHI